MKMKKMRLYRFDNLDPLKGVRYNSDWKFNCTVEELQPHPMPYEPDVYKWVYRSAVKSWEDMTHWVTKDVAEKLVANWYVFCRYLSDDYFYRDYWEICFNKTNYYKKENLELGEFYD